MEHITLAKASTPVSGSDKGQGNGAGTKSQATDETATVTDSVYGTDALAAMITTEAEPTEDITTDLVKENPFRYAGYYFDRKTQYYYLQARYYVPRPARFISEDTYEGEINNPLTLNLYTYVENNPLSYTDPSGHKISGKLGMGFASTASTVKSKIKKARAGGLNSKVYWKNRAFLGSQAEWFFPNAKKDGNNYFKYLFNMATKTSKNPKENTEGKAGWAESTMASMFARERNWQMLDTVNNVLIGLGDSYLVKNPAPKLLIAEDTAAVVKGLGKGTGKTVNEVTNLLDKMPEFTGSTREKLLSAVQNKQLSEIVNELYRPGATFGDGGTAAKLIEEFSQGSSKHLQKAQNRLSELNNLAKSGKLGLNDLDIVDALRDDLEKAINLFK